MRETIDLAPGDVMRTNWLKDPFAFGSYSYLPVGATPELRRILAEPVTDQIFWAGEATSMDAPSTVHGALASGRTAADTAHGRLPASSRIIVLGAGAAGAAAADSLMRLGHEVLVLEARDRVGGRVATIDREGWDVPLEFGASWVHDADGHDLVTRVADAGASTEVWDWDETRVIGETADASDRSYATFEAALEEAVEFAQDRDDDRSLQAAIEQSGAAADLSLATLVALLQREISTEYGADASDLSATWGLEEGTDGVDRLVLDGYGRLIDDLLSDAEVVLGDAITRIDRRAGGVMVHSGTGITREADAVVVTVPLSILQAGAIEFDPPLPASTVAAQAGLAMGVLDKVFVRFDSAVWSNDALSWSLAGIGPEPFREWLNLEPLTGVPVLMALIGGRHAVEWSERSDDDVRLGAEQSLHRLLEG